MKKIIPLFIFTATLVTAAAQAKDYGSIFYSDEAEKYLEKWSSDKAWSESLIQAQNAYKTQNYAAAAKAYEQAFKLGYQNAQGTFNLADSYERLEKINPAIETYKAAIKQLRQEKGGEATLFKASYRLGVLEAGKKNYEEAANYLEQARQLQSNDAQLLFNLAVVRQKQQKWEEAKKWYQEVLRLDPSFEEAKTHLDKLNAKQHLPTIKSTGPILSQKKPYDIITLNALKKEDVAKKIEQLQAQLNHASEKEKGDLHYKLALYYTTAGQTESALAELKKISASSGIEQLDFLKGLLYFQLGEVQKGAQAYHHYLRHYPGDPLGHYNLAVLYDNQTQHSRKAIHHYRRYLQLAKDKAQDADDVGRRIWALSNSPTP